MENTSQNQAQQATLMSSIRKKPLLPEWGTALVKLGGQFASKVRQNPSRRITIALCLPCLDYAAAFVGLGIIGKPNDTSSGDSMEERMKGLLGKDVSFKVGDRTLVGVLSWCSMERVYQIEVKRKNLATGLYEIEPDCWAKVHPVGRELNRNRRLSPRQVQAIADQNSTIGKIGLMTGCDLWEPVLGESGKIFSVYGNKSRITREISESLFPAKSICLEKILRPEGFTGCDDSYHCAVESGRSAIDGEEGAMVIIEGGRTLPDQLAASRRFNRVILIERSAANYEDSAAAVMEQASLRIDENSGIEVQLPGSIRILSFCH